MPKFCKNFAELWLKKVLLRPRPAAKPRVSAFRKGQGGDASLRGHGTEPHGKLEPSGKPTSNKNIASFFFNQRLLL
jgi:hypothetical protein